MGQINSIGQAIQQGRKSLFGIILNSQTKAPAQRYNFFFEYANFSVIYNRSKLEFFLVYSNICCISQRFCSQSFRGLLSDFWPSGTLVHQESEKVQQTDFRNIFVVFSCLYGFFFVWFPNCLNLNKYYKYVKFTFLLAGIEYMPYLCQRQTAIMPKQQINKC